MFECSWIGGDPTQMDDVELSEHVLAVAEHVDRLRAALLVAVGEFDARGLCTQDLCPNPTRWLSQRTLTSSPEARRLVTVAHDLRDAPKVAAALAEGRLSVEQARLLAELRIPRLAQLFDEHQEALVEAASQLSVDDTRRLARAWRMQADGDGPGPGDDDFQWVRLSTTGEGRGVLNGELAAEGVLIVNSVLRQIMAELFDEAKEAGRALPTVSRQRADALVEMARRATAAGDKPAARPLIVVRTDLSDLFARAGWESGRPPTYGLRHVDDDDGDGADRAGGQSPAGFPEGWEWAGSGRFGSSTDQRGWAGCGRPTTDYGEPVAPWFFRELLCDADVVRVITDGPSQVLDVGRAERTATVAQRRALLVRDGGCVFPGCDRPPGWCHAHHIKYWNDDGRTDLDNLCLLCNYHHHRKHQGLFTIEVAGEGRFIFRHPNGELIEAPSAVRSLEV